MKIILASQSPRRLEILNKHGYTPIVMPSDIDETIPNGMEPSEAVKFLSLKKAKATYNQIKNLDEYKESIIIASDTIVFKDEIMGKPIDENDAFRMLSKIKDASHQVITGVAILFTSNSKIENFSDTTTVYCKDLSDKEIWDYIKTGEPMDKAGSYAIQGIFNKYIDHIDGDYENVVGLPFYRISEFLNNSK